MGFREATPREAEDTLGLPVCLLSPAVLALQRGGGVDHVMVGRLDGQEVRCFNVRIRGGGWTDVPAVARRVKASFASTVIRPLRGKLPPRPGMKLMRYESEGFNNRIAVYSTDAYFASAIVDARMMGWLLTDLHGVSIELADHWVVAWRNTRGGRIRSRLRDLLETLERFDDHIPRAVPSLFPDSHTHLRWRRERIDR